MDSQFDTNFGYASDADAELAGDEEGDGSGIGEEQPEGPFNLAELEILAHRRREWTQARKKEKAIILREIYKEFAKIGRNRDLSLVQRQEKEEQITAWLKKPLRTQKPRITIRSAYKYSVRSVVWEIYHEQIQEKHALMKNEGATKGDHKRIDLYQQALTNFIQEDLTEEQLAAAHDIAEKWNGPEGPSAEVQARNAKKYTLKFMKNFAEEMWRYCGMRMVSLTGWKDEDGAVQACCMDFNSDIASGSAFNDIHTLDATWRDYLGTAYENPDISGGEEVPNIAAHRPRAKKGDPVQLVMNEDGEIWIGDLTGRSRDTILQMVRGYLTAHYRRACKSRSATVPFKKLGRYQAEMIATRHLPENFSFTVDPSHMRLSVALDLLNFWRERQIANPNDVFSFQKWLDQSGNLWEMRDARVPSPPTPPAAYDVDLFNRMRDARVPSPPSPPAAYDVDLFNRMRDARVPSLPSPPTATEADTSKKLQSAEAPSPPSQREGLRIEQEDEPDRSGRIDFGDPDRARLREWFMLGLTGPSLSADDRLALERAGLANADTADDVLRALQDLKSQHTLDLHIVRTMKRIATDIQHLVENRVKSTHLGLYMIDSIDLLELSRYPNLAPDVQRYTGGPPYPTRQSAIEMAIIYWGLRVECAVVHLLGLPRVSDWPTQWFYNVLLDLKELDHLILVTVSRHSFTPMLPACFHAYLRCQEDKDRFQEEIRNIPLGAFHMIDSLAHYIPDWTQRTPNKYTGFVFPWWLHGSSNYPADFQKLSGGRVFPIAAEYFQYKWPTANPSIGDKVDTWIQGQVQNQMKYLREIQEDVEANGRKVNHLFSQWAALSGLLGRGDID
ncbi:hypothetical protein EDD15DRAFT_2195693 [Pisolithus albus]|nr:hypothetical protein EDD15DRAFT_2195693 [Pisolithus albus]